MARPVRGLGIPQTHACQPGPVPFPHEAGVCGYFYAHRHDPETPLEETAGALITAVRSGKALYAGISKFPAEQARQMCSMLGEAGVPCLVHQVRYNMFSREPETSVFQAVRETGIGCVAFSPLAQGMLTDRYLEGIPEDSRARVPPSF